MNRPPTPATVWADRVTKARRQEHVATSCAAFLAAQPRDLTDPFADDLRIARYRAATADADAWAEYARRCEEAFADAADAEMRRADEQDARRHRYDEVAS